MMVAAFWALVLAAAVLVLSRERARRRDAIGRMAVTVQSVDLVRAMRNRHESKILREMTGHFRIVTRPVYEDNDMTITNTLKKIILDALNSGSDLAPVVWKLVASEQRTGKGHATTALEELLIEASDFHHIKLMMIWGEMDKELQA